jgi:hypothetical protein
VRRCVLGWHGKCHVTQEAWQGVLHWRMHVLQTRSLPIGLISIYCIFKSIVSELIALLAASRGVTLHSGLWLGSLRFGSCNGTARQVVTGQMTFCAAGVRSIITLAHCSYSTYNGEMLFWTGARAECVVLTSRPSPFLLRTKLNEADIFSRLHNQK